MKKNMLILLLSLCGVLVSTLVFGVVLLRSQSQPHPQVECEAMRPFISFNGINYDNPSQLELAHPPSISELGPVVGTAGDGPHSVRYDCGLLSSGEQVYRLKNYQPSFRLAVRTSSGLSFFEVGQNPQAKTGGDLFDVGGNVQFLTVGPIDNPESPTHTVHNPANVQKLVGEMLAAPIAGQCSFEGNEEALVLHLQDGSLVQISYRSAGAMLSTGWPQCVQLPQNFAALLAGSN